MPLQALSQVNSTHPLAHSGTRAVAFSRYHEFIDRKNPIHSDGTVSRVQFPAGYDRQRTIQNVPLWLEQEFS